MAQGPRYPEKSGPTFVTVAGLAACVLVAAVVFLSEFSGPAPGRPAAAPAAPDPALTATLLPWKLADAGAGYVTIVGEVRNDSAVPVSVDLRFTARDEAGQVVATKTFNPSGMQGISAGKSWPFERIMQLKEGTYKEATLDVVRVEPFR